MSDRRVPQAGPEENGPECSDLAEPAKQDPGIKLVIPVTVILERRMISRSFWSMPSWYLHTVGVGNDLVAGQQPRSASGEPAGTSDKGDLFVWSGLTVTLFKDECERYWHALIGEKPLVYLLCRDETDSSDGADDSPLSMRPILATLDYDAASAAAETDTPVLSAPIPGELYRAMERFVLTHYRPQKFQKRKRRNWSGEAEQQVGDNKGTATSDTDSQPQNINGQRRGAKPTGAVDE